jgi:DNA-binding IclR family transcriptional regulator
MALFEIFARERRELSKSEVARLLDVPESSSSDLLTTLQDLGFLARTPSTRRFYPTSRLLTVAQEIEQNDVLGTFAAEATSQLAQRSGETACCAVLAGERIKVVGVGEGRHRLRYVLGVGDNFSIHGTAIGKALLSGLEDTEMGRRLRLKPLSRLTKNTKVNPREVEADVRMGRERGWQSAQDEGTIGVSSLAVAGLIGDQVVGLGIIGPTERIVPARDELAELLLELKASVFSDGLGERAS